MSLNEFHWLEELSKKKKISKDYADALDARQSFLCVVIGGKSLYISAGDIAEVMAKEKVSLVGHTKSWFKGLIKAQGEIFSLIDISPFLGVKPVNMKHSYIIALSRQYDNIAIVVDSLNGLRSFEKIRQIEQKEYLDVFRVGDEKLNILSIERLLSSDEFFDISVY